MKYRRFFREYGAYDPVGRWQAKDSRARAWAPGAPARLPPYAYRVGLSAIREYAFGANAVHGKADWAPQRTKSAPNDQSGTPHLAILATPSGGAR